MQLAPTIQKLIPTRVLPLCPELLDEDEPIPLSVLKLVRALLEACPAWVADTERYILDRNTVIKYHRAEFTTLRHRVLTRQPRMRAHIY